MVGLVVSSTTVAALNVSGNSNFGTNQRGAYIYEGRQLTAQHIRVLDRLFKGERNYFFVCNNYLILDIKSVMLQLVLGQKREREKKKNHGKYTRMLG